MKTCGLFTLSLAGLLALGAGGCGRSAPTSYYALEPTAAPIGAYTPRLSVLIEPVIVPAAVDRPEMVVRVAENRVDIDELHRWDAPLGDSIARVVARDLAAQLGAPDVASAPIANFNPDYRVSINIQRFQSERGKTALLDAVWTVRDSATGGIRTGRTVANENVSGDGYEALAQAHSRALEALSSDIAAAIRKENPGRR